MAPVSDASLFDMLFVSVKSSVAQPQPTEEDRDWQVMDLIRRLHDQVAAQSKMLCEREKECEMLRKCVELVYILEDENAVLITKNNRLEALQHGVGE
jgi:hypothetical protein